MREDSCRDREPELLFSGMDFRTPLEELESVAARKIHTFRELGDTAKTELYRRALELARDRLAEVLSEEV